MNEKNETTKPAAITKKTLDVGELIPVADLFFHRVGGVDLPGKKGASHLRGSHRYEDGSYEITYAPRTRHHRVIYTPSNKEKPTQTIYVHESWCAWEPLE